MVGEADDDALAEHLRDGILGRLAGVLIGDAEDCLEGLPAASSRDHPVSVSATGLRNVTRPSPSVAITASPMLRSVVVSQATYRPSCPRLRSLRRWTPKSRARARPR